MKTLVIVTSTMIGFSAGAFGATVAKNAAKSTEVSTAPASYHARQGQFRKIMARESSRAAKIVKAGELVRDARSPYRVDAINFLAETKSREAVFSLLAASRDVDVRSFALYALGEIPSEKSIPVLIEYLSDDDENVRGNAERALRKITHVNFLYNYAAPVPQRKRGIEDARAWWKTNGKTFKVTEESPEEKKAAEDAWEKYGKGYVYDLSR